MGHDHGIVGQHERLERATAALDPPLAVVDLDAFDANAAQLARRAAGKPIRVASKSVRCRALLRRALALPGFQGVLAFTLPEALWLAEEEDDVVVAYPTADRQALRALAGDPQRARHVTLMVDSAEHLDVIDAVLGTPHPELRVCLDLDASLRLFAQRVHFGARRSPVHEPEQARRLAQAVVARPGFRLVGMMAYEAQVAGVGDDQPGQPLRNAVLRAAQRASMSELRERRAAAVAAVSAVAPLEFVNGGGTGSVERTATESAVTELAAGSGLYAPTLFDGYRAFTLQPAALFAASVVRRPAPGVATVLGAGWPASGASGKDRLPVPVYPAGLALTALEGAGEVQTPLTGEAAGRLRIGDRVWFRHAKAGELAERVNVLHLVEGDEIVAEAPTYRGEGRALL